MERKEAIEVIKKNWPDSSFMMLREALETLIPELAESEEEKIKKLLIEAVIQVLQDQYCSNRGVSKEKVLAWIEKQGEPSEWTEDDEERFKSCIRVLQTSDGYDTINAKWFKSLKNRYTWRPSEAQMASITCAVRKMKESACYDSELVHLLQDLEKLRGE